MEKKKIKALYQLIFLNVFVGKKIGNESEEKLNSRKVDPNRPNGPSELKQTVMDRARLNRL